MNVYEFFRNNHILAVCEDTINSKSFTLNLSRFDMHDVPELAEKCEFIMKLFLNNNHLTELPDGIGDLARLHILTLDYNSFTEFPRCVCRLNNLSVLNVSCNQIARLPSEIGHLTQLETFWCNNTGLLELPEQLGNCERLETLGARGNKLQRLPNSINQLVNLRWLTLEGNELSEVPNTLCALDKLIHLNLKRNRLTKVPTCLKSMKKLRFVFLNCNRIEELPTVEDCEETRFMRMLNVGENPICSQEAAQTQFEQFPHIYYEELDYKCLNSNGLVSLRGSDEQEEEQDDTLSDWENSIETSDLDTTDDSTPENEVEDISVLIPELSRYITNFS